MSLSLDQEHLLKRELLRLEVGFEADQLDNLINIDLLGKPFVTKQGFYADDENLPIFRYVFANFIVPFPFFAKASDDVWVNSVQPFIQGLASKDISSSADRDEATKRRRMARAVKRMVLLLMIAGMNSNRPKDPTGKYKMPARYAVKHNEEPDMLPLESAAVPSGLSRRPDNQDGDYDDKLLGSAQESIPNHPMGPRASAIGARNVPGGMFKSRHSEYIVEAQFWGGEPVWTAHSYSDFQALHKGLIREFPGKPLPRLPSQHSYDSTVLINGKETTLLRERQRLTLRYYLFQLCEIQKVANSNVLLEFLFKDKIQLTQEEIKDIEVRIAVDKQRWDSRNKFTEIAAERSKKLDIYLREIKSEILLEDALPKLFFEMREHRRVEDMSPLVQKFCEYCLVEVAALIYHLLIARDDSPELFSQVKRLHRLVPYMVMQGILKLSNPAMILKKMTELFMATPFGGKSLLQTMFIRVLSDDMRSQEKLIEELRIIINDSAVYETLKAYAWLDHNSREMVHAASDASGHDLVLAIFESSSTAPVKTTAEVRRYHDAWRNAVNGLGPDDIPEVERYSQLKDLLKYTVRHRDKEILRQFWGEPMTIKFMRTAVDVTYDVFIEVFKTPQLSETVGDLEKFMNDLIKTITRMDAGMALDANQMVDELVQLCRKHQNSVFKFINKVYSREDSVFVHIISWLTRFVNFVKHGKQGLHTLDILGLVDGAAAAGQLDLDQLRIDLDVLDKWLLLRKSTADASSSGPATDAEQDMMTGGFDVSDVGLNWDDVEFGFAEVEQDEQDQFLATLNEDLSQDAVAREKFRQKKLAELEARKKQLPRRPESKAIQSLQSGFHRILSDVLAKADAKPSDLGLGTHDKSPLQ